MTVETESKTETPEKNVQVVEKRVKSTVIRRRRKAVEAAPPAPVEEGVVQIEATATEEGAAPTAPARPRIGVVQGAAPVGIVKPKKTPPGEANAPKATEAAAEAGETTEPGEDPSVSLKCPTDAERKIGVVGHINLETIVVPTEKVKEDWREKMRKGTTRRKSRAELEAEAIQRAGGLRSYASIVGQDGFTPGMDRVFRPGPTGRRRKATRRMGGKKTQITEPKAIKKVIRIEDGINVSNLSQALGVKANEIITKLMDLEIMATVNQIVDVDMATIIAEEYGFTVEHTAFKEEEILVDSEAHGSPENLEFRAPVVTVMGHVDHGKTSILDVIRKSDVASGEAGGITQHIGAYEVKVPKGKITFLDTPGHAAFTSMRARGAQATDIVILVVAADDGIMPQSIEAIDHSKAAGVPIIVAINKIDIEDAQPDRTKQGLTEHGLVPEDWGGDVICINTSAKTGEGIDQLLEMVLLQAEILELKADKTIRPKGIVVEAKLDRGRGPVATVLVQEGTLKNGSYIVCGTHQGKVRAMFTADGTQVKEVGPSVPVEVLGLSGVPNAGDEMVGVADERGARQVSGQRRDRERDAALHRPVHASLENLSDFLEGSDAKELMIVIKGDVHGSVEASSEALEKLSTDKVKLKVLHTGVGGITESDVMLAAASNAIIVGFNVKPDPKARTLAENEGIELRSYRVIYEMIDEVKRAMEGLLEPIRKEVSLGMAEVRDVFMVSKVGTIAGSFVTTGKIQRNAKARLLRDQVVVFDGDIASLKRFKDDAREVADGYECGIGLLNFNDVKVGDVVEAYVIEETADTL
jgi:translation initiation factor IF-2